MSLLSFCAKGQILVDRFDGIELSQEWELRREDFSLSNGVLWLDHYTEEDDISSIRRLYHPTNVMQWTFDVYLAYNPSKQNRVLIYPSYYPNSSKYVYIAIGGDNNEDLYLYGNNRQELINAIELPYPEKDGFPYIVSIKLTYEYNIWTLFYSFDKKNYIQADSATYDVENPKDEDVYFHLEMHYTKTGSDKFGFDNLVIMDSITDIPAEPEEEEEKEEITEDSNIQLESIEFPDLSSILLHFSEPVDCQEASISIEEIGDAYFINSLDPQNQDIIAGFQQEMEYNQEYTLTIKGFMDENGLTIPSEERSFFLDNEEEEEENEENEKELPTGAILISEIMADPKGAPQMSDTEYIELQNTLSQDVSLDGWTLLYRGSIAIPLDGANIPAHSFLIVYRSGDEMLSELQSCAFASEKFPANIANAGQQIQLIDSHNEIMDDVTYEKSKSGISWERGETGWHLSSDPLGGTPGKINSPEINEEEKEEEEEEEKEEEQQKPEEEEEEIPEPKPTPSLPIGSILISEIMADPKEAPQMSDTEYVELQNTLSQDVSLDGWTLLYREKIAIPLDGANIPAHSFLIVYRSGDEILPELQSCSFASEKFPANISNTGQRIQLIDSHEKIMDDVTYEKSKSGISWERGETGWHLSSNPLGCTPGKTNSSETNEKEEDEDKTEEDEEEKPEHTSKIVAYNDIVINELLPDPAKGGSEYIELYNRLGTAVPLNGLALATRKSDGSLAKNYRLDSFTEPLESGEYLALTKDREGVLAFYNVPDESRVVETSLPILNNKGATLVLLNSADSSIVDEVSYDPDWHSSLLDDEKGVSLERIDPDAETNDAANWSSASSSADYGTPGYENSQYLHTADEPLTAIEKPTYSPIDGNYHFPYSLSRPGFQGNLWIFDLAGRKVAIIAQQELLSLSGEMIWNGTDSKGNRLPSGLYVVFAEFYHADGETYRNKAVIMIR